jgi:hypothetical protein
MGRQPRHHERRSGNRGSCRWRGGQTAKAEAIEFLSATLADGPVPATEVMKQARLNGHTNKAIRTAREALGVASSREGFGPGSKCLWSLPNRRSRIGAQPAKPASMGTYGKYEDFQNVAAAFGSIDAQCQERASMEREGLSRKPPPTQSNGGPITDSFQDLEVGGASNPHPMAVQR